MIVRREIVIALVEDIERESLGIEVNVPDGMTTLEAIGLMEIAKSQHLQSKHSQGPGVYLTPDALRVVAGVAYCGACSQVEGDPHAKWCERIDGRGEANRG